MVALGKIASTTCFPQGALIPLNFGGRPGCRVHSALLLKTFLNNFVHYTCLNAIIVNSNAKAFLDNTIPSIRFIATEYLGKPPAASASMLASIQGMKFYTGLAHGIFPKFFTSVLTALILGVFQDCRAVPCIWLSMSFVLLLHALGTQTTGFHATCPYYFRIFKCPGEAFVDNTNLWLTSIK